MCSIIISGNSLFSWGLGLGIMYMMSTGKVEINKLNNAMNETSKIVQELKAELSRRKTLPNLYTSQHIPTKLEMQPRNNRQILVESVVKKSTSERSDAVKVFAVPIVEEAECSSSVLTEEHLPEAFEMDQLEAELETEFLKFPWCADAFEVSFVSAFFCQMIHIQSLITSSRLSNSPVL